MLSIFLCKDNVNAQFPVYIPVSSLFQSNERREYSYIDLAEFFICFCFRKKSEILFTLSFDFSRFDL